MSSLDGETRFMKRIAFSLLASSIAVLAACNEEQSPLRSTEIRLNPAYANAYISVDPSVRRLGCAVVARDFNGAIQTAVLQRAVVPELADPIDSVLLRTVNGKKHQRVCT